MFDSRSRFIPGLFLLALIGCMNAPSGTVVTVSIDGGDRIIAVGDTLSLAASVVSTGSVSSTVTWTSSNEAVATVDAAGLLTSHSADVATVTATSTADPGKSGSMALTVVHPGVVAWTRQFGTAASDDPLGIAADASGNIYVTGYTFGVMEGANAGSADAWVRSYDAGGAIRWTRQFGTIGLEIASGIVADTNGDTYTTGQTQGDLEGLSAGATDAFVRSYDGNGAIRWTRQFGTVGSDSALGIGIDATGNVYVAGYTVGDLEGANAGSNDAYIRSYDRDGAHRWTRQFGTGNDDLAFEIAADAGGNVYVTGWTGGALEGASAGNADAFVRSYDRDGNHRWTRQFGTGGEDGASGIAVDGSGVVYTTGYTYGALEGASAGHSDGFVRAYGGDGVVLWTRQFGTIGADRGIGASTDANGNVYATGYTYGDFQGVSAGNGDAFVHSYSGDGAHRWTRQFGTSANDGGAGIVVGANGDVYATGRTSGDLQGVSLGDGDAFVRKFGP